MPGDRSRSDQPEARPLRDRIGQARTDRGRAVTRAIAGRTPARPEFRILGPLAVIAHGRPVRLHGGKQRALLAVLLLNADRTVRIRELTDKLWTDVVPADPRGTIQKYVMRLRRALAGTGAVISTEADGYRIEVQPGQLDVQVFDELVARATDAAATHELERALADLDHALQLWRAVPPLADVASEAVHRDDAPRLVERYLRAVEVRVDILLALGQHAQLCDELLELVSRYPLRERFWAQRMRALYAANRQADALEAYRTITRLLGDELGIDPGAELREVHQEILRGAPRLPPAPVAAARTARQRVRQLPMPTTGIIGRHTEIEEVVRVLGAGPDERAHPLVLLTGPEGIGKTTVAVAAGHRLADRYRDGQLFAVLCDHPLTSECLVDVLGYFLRALGAPEQAIPGRLDDAAAAFRSATADRELLVVLDNVTDGYAVRALLPGGTSSGVLVTGRENLAGLLVSPGGHHIALDALGAGDALDLLAAVAGADRVRAEPEAAQRLAALCNGSPLAVRTAAADLATTPCLSIAAYVSDLEARGVGALQTGGARVVPAAAGPGWGADQAGCAC